MTETGGQFVGTLIKINRMRKSWSQEGLCKGICAVSYLSKIEQGKVDASKEVIRLLLQRLDAKWYDDETTCSDAAKLVERLYNALLTLDEAALKIAEQEMEERWEVLLNCPYMLDFLLFRLLHSGSDSSNVQMFEQCFNERQQTLWLLTQRQYNTLLLHYPSAYSYFVAGVADYQAGNYPVAIERLQRSYDRAAEQGYVYIMLQSRVFMGNCYSDTMAFDRMKAHYRIAERLAAILDDQKTLLAIRYNIQATNLELGHIAESYAYFSSLEQVNPMALHKLAVCCEKLGKTKEAIAALNQAEVEGGDFPEEDMTRAICALVRYRLVHPHYLKEDAYGKMLITCFDRIQKQMPRGFANFHLPWVLEWYSATRQYKQAYELLMNFPYYKAVRPA